ncbi:MAG: methylhydantoinase, partial [Nitrososphaera sp.]|nr:methylhydantoinase [Nitrososphaera sp.]
KKKLFLKSKRQPVLVLDKFGRVRLSIDNAAIFNGTPEEVSAKVDSVLQSHQASGKDLAPQVHILDGIKLMDFSSLTSPEHVSKAIRDELKKAAATDVAAIIKLE